MAQVRVLGGSIGIAASTAILNMMQRARLLDTGIATPSELATVASPTVTLSPEQLLAFRLASAAAFDKSLRVCIGIAALGLLSTLGTYNRNPIDMAERRKALAMDAITAIQRENEAAAHLEMVRDADRRWKEEKRAQKLAAKGRKKQEKEVTGSSALSEPSAEASPVVDV